MKKINRASRIAVAAIGLLVASTACAQWIPVVPEGNVDDDNHYILECSGQCRPGAVASPPYFQWSSTPVILSDGRRLFAGLAGDTKLGRYSFAVKRTNRDRSPDLSFGGAGFVVVPIWGYYEGAGYVAMQADGKIIVAGDATDPNGAYVKRLNCHPALCDYYPVLIRLNADGSLDRSFNGNGKIVIAIGDTNSDPDGVQTFGTLTGISLGPEGKIVTYEGTTATAIVNADGTLDTSFRGTGKVAREVPFADYEGLWYAAPAESEAGWGITFAQQNDTIYAVWYTYEGKGNKPWWYTLTAVRTSSGTYQGTLSETRGPRFDSQPFDRSQVETTAVGDATLTFTDAANGMFEYNVSGVRQTKKITRQIFGPPPICYGAQADPGVATNYQSIWYATPAESEAGWGVYLTHQADTIFVTWFTYGPSGDPVWFAGTAKKADAGGYNGILYLTSGPAFGAVPWKKDEVSATKVGTFALGFANGNSADFSYSVTLDSTSEPIAQHKKITRQVFRDVGTICY